MGRGLNRMHLIRTRMADTRILGRVDLDKPDIDRRPRHVYTRLSTMTRMLRSSVSSRDTEYYFLMCDHPGHTESLRRDLFALFLQFARTGTSSCHCYRADDRDSVESDVPYRFNTRMEYVLDTEVCLWHIGHFPEDYARPL